MDVNGRATIEWQIWPLCCTRQGDSSNAKLHCRLKIILLLMIFSECIQIHDDVIKWKHFPRYWPFVRGIHRSLVKSPHKGHWPGALMFSLICAWINGCVNNREVGDLRRYRANYEVTVMIDGSLCLTKSMICDHFWTAAYWATLS